MMDVFRSLARLLLLAALVAFPLAVRAAAPPPLEAYGDLPQLEGVALSPEGTKVSCSPARPKAFRPHTSTPSSSCIRC